MEHIGGEKKDTGAEAMKRFEGKKAEIAPPVEPATETDCTKDPKTCKHELGPDSEGVYGCDVSGTTCPYGHQSPAKDKDGRFLPKKNYVE